MTRRTPPAGGVRRVFARVVLIAVPLTGDAAAAWAYQVLGSGLSSCGTWIADKRSNWTFARLNLSWVLAWLSTVGYQAAGDPLNHVDRRASPAWIDNYCHANPIKQIVDAAQAFYDTHPN